MKFRQFVGETIGDCGVEAGRVMVEQLFDEAGNMVATHVITKPAGSRRWGPPITLNEVT
jgi:hypothetical protein